MAVETLRGSCTSGVVVPLCRLHAYPVVQIVSVASLFPHDLRWREKVVKCR